MNTRTQEGSHARFMMTLFDRLYELHPFLLVRLQCMGRQLIQWMQWWADSCQENKLHVRSIPGSAVMQQYKVENGVWGYTSAPYMTKYNMIRFMCDLFLSACNIHMLTCNMSCMLT